MAMPQVVTVESISQQSTWVDAAGNRWTMGDVTPNGWIVGAPGTFIASGVVFIHESQLKAAEAFRWERVDEIAPNGMTRVNRASI